MEIFQHSFRSAAPRLTHEPRNNEYTEEKRDDERGGRRSQNAKLLTRDAESKFRYTSTLQGLL